MCNDDKDEVKKMKTLKTKNGIKIDVRSIDTFADNAKIVKFSPHQHSRGDYVEGFEVNIDVDATLIDGASKSFTVILQSADRSNKMQAYGLADMLFAQYYGADWDEIAKFLIGLAESECKKWYEDNKNEGANDNRV